MKKIIILVCLFLLLPVSANSISAETAIVMDGDSGRVLYGKDIHRKKLVASTSKIMTALVVIENVNLKKQVTVDEKVLKAHGSAIYIELGEKISVLDLLYGLMLRSGNDAAIVLAEAVGGSMENFAVMMNLRASEIGMENTIFYNSHGLEEKGRIGNTSTAYDMAILTRVAMQNQTFRTISGMEKWRVTTNYKTYLWRNKNRLIHSYQYTTGGKTGFTELARRTLVTTATKDNKNLIVVTLNDGNDFANHKALYEEYFNKYQLVRVLNKDKFRVKEDKFYRNEKLVIKNDFNVLIMPNERKDIKKVIELEKIRWPRDNERVGVVKVFLKDKLMHEESIYVAKTPRTESIGFWYRILDFLRFWD